MHEQEIQVQSGDVTLVGTICLPEKTGQFPAVLMVHGSGPLDRNSNMRGLQLNIFNTIAHALAECGIASLRYDKRGCGKSSGDFMTSGHSDLVEDASCCFDTLAKSAYVSKNNLYILGHSEGSIIAPQIALRCASVSGLILLCPFIERLEFVLIRQAAQLEKEIDSLAGISGFLYRALFRLVGRPSSTQQRLLQKVRKTNSPIVRVAGARQPARWLREMLEMDMESIFNSTETPMLLIAGEKDLQCNPQDIFRIAKVSASESETLLVNGMTHLLRADENSPTLLGSARLCGKAIEPVVMEKTVQWILTQSATKSNA